MHISVILGRSGGGVWRPFPFGAASLRAFLLSEGVWVARACLCPLVAVTAAVCLSFLPVVSRAQTAAIDLSGEWRFAVGDEPAYDDTITLPGSMLTGGKGDDVTVSTRWTGSLYDSSFFFNPYMERYRVDGQMKFPFFLTPAKHYVGKAWYGRVVSVPSSWAGRRVFVRLERPHIETTLYVNGVRVGRDSSLSVPHVYEVTDMVRAGSDNTIDILVYNGIENVCVGQDSHSVTDQTQGNWNGVAGRVELLSKPQAFISNVQVYPDLSARELTIRCEVDDAADAAGKTYGTVVTVRPYGDSAAAPIYVGEKTLSVRPVEGGRSAGTIVIPLQDSVKTWDEFAPNLYMLTTVMGGDSVETVFGVREFTACGRQFYINGRKTWLRGTVENCCFPLTGYPPTDEASWTEIFIKCKEYGLNMMRFHSYCPPEAAFAAADKVGIYLQPEGPSWPNHGVKLRRGMTIDSYLLEETKRMVREYGNHPSFCMLSACNEPAGDWVSWASDFVDYWESTGDTRRVYCGASVGGGWAFDPKSEYHVKGGARGLDWKRRPQSTDNHYASITRFEQKTRDGVVTYDIGEPYVSHEQGQWCAFPSLRDTSLYTGAYKAYNYVIFNDLLRDNGMAGQGEKFLMASGKLQTLAYKYDIERNLRTPDYAGFQLLGLNDYTGQGTATVGVLNVFWQEKGYCGADDWTAFCSPLVPLAKFPKFVYVSTDTLDVDIELYYAGAETLHDARAVYAVCGVDGDTLSCGTLCMKDIEPGKNIPLGDVSMALDAVGAPAKLALHVRCAPETGAYSDARGNSYDFWVYPARVDMPDCPDIHITDTLDDRAVAVLRSGGKVLVTAAGKVSLGSDVAQTYLPVFWNTSWFKMRPPHTTGAYIDTSHPLFRYFPSDDWTNLNWWELVNGAQVMNLCLLPSDYQSPVQPIDTWHVSRKLGMIVEANVLGGKLLITTLNITDDLDRRVVARQMRRAILEYMSSDEFAPTMTIDADVVTAFFTREAAPVNMFTTDTPDELKPKL